MDEVAEVRCGRHLALVDAGVPVLGILDLECPVFGLLLVDGTEALVARVSVPSNCEQMDVSVSHPRHLEQKVYKCYLMLKWHQIHTLSGNVRLGLVRLR